MAFEYSYVNGTVLSKLKIGEQIYHLKDAEARAALEAEINKLGTAAYRAAADVVVEDSNDLVSGKAVAKYLEGTLADVTKALIFQGVAGEGTNFEENKVYIEGELLVASKGDVVIDGHKEYVFDGAKWIELGDESLYLTKNAAAQTYVAKTLTIAGIDLQDNISVDELKTALNLKALAHKDSASGSVSTIDSISIKEHAPEGTVTSTIVPTTADMNASGAYTPAGNVSGTTVAAGNVALARDDAGVAITGTVSKPNITVNTSYASVQHIDSLGKLASYTEATYVAPTMTPSTENFATKGTVVALDETDGEMLCFSDAATLAAMTSAGFNAGSYTPAKYTQGELPTLGAEMQVLTGASAELANAPTFTGDKFGASFTGVASDINASFAGTAATISVSGQYEKAGSINSTFKGAKHACEVEISRSAKTITVQ